MPKSEVERQQSVQNLLKGMQGIEPLKKLFWTDLNYDRANISLPRKGWGEHASSALAQDPTLFATGGGDFHVIYARLNSDKLLVGMERPVVSRMLQEHPYALFIFSNASQDRWHFVNVRYEDDVQRRRLFRRITVGPEERPYLRTASECLDKINLAHTRDLAPITIQKRHDDAFDVEPVTKEFFRHYGLIFDEVENSIQGIRDSERKRLFTQRLFNRIMFIAFVQKKGWLKFNSETDYLSALWKAYERDDTVADKNFYRDRLKLLFFSGLNTTNDVNQVGINRGGFLRMLIGGVPYLNGGLFEEDDDDKNSDIVVPDKALNTVLNDLFVRFNFTVTESTPLDVEVAVDPEMLGKIFEELVTGRHETGSYYTPKPVVSFMCRQALKAYLAARVSNEARSAIQRFVEEHDPSKLNDAEAVLDALRKIRTCDLACGSGAYLLGMLHELVDLRQSLFSTKNLDAMTAYERKLEIIQNNVYGVDVDPFAVNIARLRLWLSLAVDFVLWDDEITKRLADFQKVAVRQAVQVVRDHGGVFVADVVGLGKSYIGAAIVKHFERTDHARPMILCPAALVDMWERYNEVYQLNARVLSTGFLREADDGAANLLLENVKYRDRDFVLVDESHNLRYPDTQRYKLVQSFLSTGRRSCFLTATPRNKSAWDVYYQIKLFHPDDKTDLPVNPPDLKQYFKLIEKGEKNLPDLLANILIRRTRNHILRWYGFDSETHQPVDPGRFRDYVDGHKRAYVIVAGRHQFFPKRELETIDYSIEETYQGLYQELRGYLGKPRKGEPPKKPSEELTYARYGLWHYVPKDKQKQEPYASLHRAGPNLRGLIRVLLFKRFESSVYAFKETIRRLLRVHESFLAALARGIVPAGEDAQKILYESDYDEETDLLDALREVSVRYDAADFDLATLRRHIEHDIRLFNRILGLVEPITPAKDAKLQTLKRRLAEQPLKDGKRLIFTQYADTARYLFENLNPGGKRDDIEVIFSGDKSKARVVGRFAPKANPEYQRPPGEAELSTVIATDVLAEGLNLQDCDKIVNYDLHWNPVRLIQRFGRIDRIGSDHDVVYGFNFLPETGIERELGLRQKLQNRIQEIHDTIGEDSAILDRTEQLNEEAMYAIYEKKGADLSLFEEEEDEFVDLNEAEEILRQLRKDDPVEFERIAELRDGIRAAMPSTHNKLYVFCQAGRYQQLFLVDSKGEVASRDIPPILAAIKCGPRVAGVPVPSGYNAAVMRVKRQFEEEVKHRQAEREHTLSLTHGQRYVLRELRVLFGLASDEDVKAQINILEKAFRGPITAAINRELNLLRRNGVTGENLMGNLARLYHQHNMKEWLDRRTLDLGEHPIPRIICSEALL